MFECGGGGCNAYTTAYKVEVVNQNLNLTHAATANGSCPPLTNQPTKMSASFVFAICLFDICFFARSLA